MRIAVGVASWTLFAAAARAQPDRPDTGYSAYSPDLDGCVAAGDDRDATIALMREAIAFHLEGLAIEGLPVPSP